MSTAITLYKETIDTLLLQADALGAHIPASDRRIIKAQGYKSIAKYNDNELTTICGKVVMGVMRNIGIHRQPDEFDGAQFMLTLKLHFADLTIEDVRNAFELFNLHELDPWLEKDAKGRPIDHFQQFSQRFYIAVLKAYQRKQHDTKHAVAGKVAFLLHAKQEEERDPHADRAAFILVVKDIALAVGRGEERPYIMTAEMEYILFRAKLLPETFDITGDDRSRARITMTHNKDSAVGASINNILKDAGVHPELEGKARNYAVRRLFKANAIALGQEEVARRFDWLAERQRAKAKKVA